MARTFEASADPRDGQTKASKAPAAYIGAGAMVNFLVAGAASTMIFWIPKVAQETLGMSLPEIGTIMGPMFLIGIIISYAVSHLSDRSGSRYPYVVWSALLAAGVMGASAGGGSSSASYAILIAFLVARCIGGIFMAALSEDLQGRSAPLGFAIAMVAAGVGQFIGNWLFGLTRDETGAFTAGLAMLAAMMAAAALAALLMMQLRRGFNSAREAEAE